MTLRTKVVRLLTIDQTGMLIPEQRQRMTKKIWSRLKNGLPDLPGWRLWNYMELEYGSGQLPTISIKNYFQIHNMMYLFGSEHGCRITMLSFFDSIEAASGRQKDLALVSLFVIWDRMENRPFISKQRYEEIISSQAYRDTITQGTSVKGRIEKRFRSVYEKLSGYDS